MDVLLNLGAGLIEAVSPINLLYCFIGVTLGTAVGVLPGIGGMTTMAILLPVIYYVPQASALIMLAGIYYGAQYGGSTTAIMLKIPGEVSSTVTLLDGYPMAQQGKAGTALVISAIACFFGGTIAVLILAFAAPPLARMAIAFGPAEYCSIMILGLVATSAMSQGSVVKSFAMIILGFAFGLVGMDVNTGDSRMTFGSLSVFDGVSIVSIAIGLFGIPEIVDKLQSTSDKDEAISSRLPWRQLIPKLKDLRESFMAMVRGTVLGSFVGVLPGAGASIASFASYAMELRVAKDPSRFGKGAIEGVAGPEAASNAAAQTAFIPTLTLGVPGSATMALFLGAMIVQGVMPGPQLVTSHPVLFWTIISSMLIGNLMLIILNLPLIGIWIRLLTIPYGVLYPAILMLCCLGVYSINLSISDVFLMAGFGILGFIFLKLGCPPASFLVGFILGPLFEENLRRAMLMSRGNPLTFIDRPISLGILLATAAIVVFLALPSLRKLKARRIELTQNNP